MKKGTYVTLQSWMVDELELEGIELIIYAIIYGFSQEESSEYTGSLNYLAEWTRKTKKTVIENLKKLVNKNLIIKTEVNQNGVKFCKYKTNFNYEKGGVKITPGVVKKLHQGGVKITHNNIEDNTYSSINNSNIGKNKKTKKKKEFIPPTLEEVKAYCKERNNNVDAEKFYDYYAVADWKNKEGKPVRNWKQTVISWEGRNNNTSSKPQNESKPYYECVNPNVSYDYDDYDEGIR